MFVRPLWRARFVVVGAIVLIAAWDFTIRPSNTHDWQAEVAEALNVSPEAVTLWESGRRRMELSKIPRLAGMQRVWVAEKNLTHRRRIAGEHERRDPRHAHGEPIAVAACASVEETKRIAHEVEGGEKSGTRR